MNIKLKKYKILIQYQIESMNYKIETNHCMTES